MCPSHLLEGIEGDLLEQFEEDLNSHGSRRARRNFNYHVLRFFRLEILARKKFNGMPNWALLTINIRISLRNLYRNFSYSLINLLGLGIGIACCLLIYNYTDYQLSFDKFHANVDELYRINQTAIWDPAGGLMGSTPPPLAKQLLENVPEISATMRINTPGESEVRCEHPQRGLLAFRESNILAADSNFFEFFDLPLIAGDPKQALVGKNKVVITKEIAEKYFQNSEALGQTLFFHAGKTPVIVSGVLQSLPSNMHFSFDFLLSMPTNEYVEQFDWSWIWTQVVTYARISRHVNLEQVESRATEILNPQIRATMNRIGMDYDDFMKDKGSWKFTLQPVVDIHLHSSELGNRLGPLGNFKAVKILRLMAFMILFMAVINFINLSTARASTRSKEVGVKKTLGAKNLALTSQFQVESLLMTVIASLLSIPILLGFTRLIESLTGIQLYLGNLLSIHQWPFILIGVLIIGFMAGIYPSLYLTSFRPINILSKTNTSSPMGGRLRNFLVTGQFAISIALLSGTLIVGKQLAYLSQKDLGFDREDLLVINHAEALAQQIESFRDALRQVPQCVSASIAMDVPGRGAWEDIFEREGSSIQLPISQVKIDPYFFPTFNLQMTVGRPFQPNRIGDERSIVINETTARLFGWSPEQALDQKILYPGLEPLKIIGVVNDFHFQSLYTDIRPLAFFHHHSSMWGDQRVVAIKYQAGQLDQLLATTETLWNKFAGQSPFAYSILDRELDQLYEEDERLANFMKLLTYLSVIIALLGLVGLISYTTQQRKKEIGIRKVLGASMMSIFVIIHRKYIALMFIALVLAVPVTVYFANSWLADFAYHISMPWHLFLFAAIMLLVLSILSVGYLVYGAAKINPVEVIQDQ